MSTSRPGFELSAVQANAIAAAVSRIPGVARLDGGRFGEVSVLFPGQRVTGLRRPDPRDDTHLQIYIALDTSAGVPIGTLAPSIRSAALDTCPQLHRVDVVFADAVAS